jgi:calcineurin-like phosphoesterase family protein
MDEALVELWNKFVKPEDSVYHLGDLTLNRGNHGISEFIKLIRSLHGHKRLQLGNHDHYDIQVYIDAGFEKIRGTGRWLDGLILSHYPIHPSGLNGSAVANIHGHIHDHESPPPAVTGGFDGDNELKVRPYINVSVDVTNYRPLTLGEVKDLIRTAKEKIIECKNLEISD